jgi:glycosyltransferase involved in cell wall biosynthesis
MPANTPDVALLVASHNRPASLQIVLRSLDEQRYQGAIEVAVVDDSNDVPDISLSPHVRFIRTAIGTSLGEKLNIGATATSAPIMFKIDDDDWYGPDFVERMVSALGESADFAFVQPFRIFDLQDRSIRWADPDRCSGSGIAFRRSVWARTPFRSRRAQVDGWFMADALSTGASPASCEVGDQFLYIRNAHGSHLWSYLPDGTTFEQYFAGLLPADEAPEMLLPEWVLEALANAPEANL